LVNSSFVEMFLVLVDIGGCGSSIMYSIRDIIDEGI
jgi:hypothetical protein